MPSLLATTVEVRPLTVRRSSHWQSRTTTLPVPAHFPPAPCSTAALQSQSECSGGWPRYGQIHDSREHPGHPRAGRRRSRGTQGPRRHRPARLAERDQDIAARSIVSTGGSQVPYRAHDSQPSPRQGRLGRGVESGAAGSFHATVSAPGSPGAGRIGAAQSDIDRHPHP